jgi:hypothetical protein
MLLRKDCFHTLAFTETGIKTNSIKVRLLHFFCIPDEEYDKPFFGACVHTAQLSVQVT